MALKIVSPRIGTPGETFETSDETNVQALIDGGFIVETNPKKSAITTTKPDADPTEKD